MGTRAYIRSWRNHGRRQRARIDSAMVRNVETGWKKRQWSDQTTEEGWGEVRERKGVK